MLWKWVLRPIVVAISGIGGAAAVESSPIAGAVFFLISLAGVVAIIKDLV